MPPRVAITPWLRELPTPLGERTALYALDPAYAAKVAAAGGQPLLLTHEVEPAAALAGVDALLLSGGGDIAPASYGGDDGGECEDVDPRADRWELELIAEARRLRLPTLGICRGMQLLAVAHGGRLAQAVANRVLHPGMGELPPLDTLALRHEVEVEPDSRLASVMGAERLRVNTIHHHAVSDPGSLRVSAQAADGTIEALEATDWPAIGVQWHPEKMAEADQQPLFAFLVERGEAHRSSRKNATTSSPSRSGTSIAAK